MIDLGAPPKIWMPPKPAIIRSAADLPKRATFPTPTYCPGGKVRNFTLVGAIETTGTTVTVPAGVKAKDVAVLFQYGRAISGTPPALVTPSPLVSVDTRTVTFTSGSTVSDRLAAAIGLLTGAEAGQDLTGFSGSKVLLIFRPIGGLTGVVAQSIAGQLTTGNPTLQTITASAYPGPVIVVGFSRPGGAGFTPQPTGTLVTNGTMIGSNTGAWGAVWFEVQAGATVDRTFDVGDSADPNALQSFVIVPF